MQYASNLASAIGNTPLIKLRQASEETGCTILGKAEFLNPGQSVKDRAALSIIKNAINSGKLKPGGTIVEGTAGNTGIGLALVGASMGFKTVIVIPETQSKEKKDMIRLAGAELIEVPAVPYKNSNNYIKYSGRLAEKLAETLPSGAIWANQFDNVANRQAHIDTTGPEIWRQTKGVDIGLADPMGAALYSFYKDGVLSSSGNSITEGIGQGRITENLKGFAPDFSYQINDEEALNIVFDLMENEGLCLGSSSGINIAGAKRLANDLGPGKTIVTILCDYGTRYQSKLFNYEFLRSKGLPTRKWMNTVESNLPTVFED